VPVDDAPFDVVGIDGHGRGVEGIADRVPKAPAEGGREGGKEEGREGGVGGAVGTWSIAAPGGLERQERRAGGRATYE
jgi:hypothetical protein